MFRTHFILGSILKLVELFEIQLYDLILRLQYNFSRVLLPSESSDGSNLGNITLVHYQNKSFIIKYVDFMV